MSDICYRCLLRTLPLRSSSKQVATKSWRSGALRASISTSSSRANKNPASQAAPSSSANQPPAATTTSSAQPLSSADTPSPSTVEAAFASAAPAQPESPTRPKVTSSVPAGTPLLGLNYFKNKKDPVALEDHEYPDWLWEVLKPKESTAGSKEVSDPRLYARSAKTRRAANKRARQRELENPKAAEQQAAIYEQTIDLPTGDGSTAGSLQAAAVRDDLNKAMRNKRRKDIKEDNYLRSMG